jgi:hypothetical protein
LDSFARAALWQVGLDYRHGDYLNTDIFFIKKIDNSNLKALGMESELF